MIACAASKRKRRTHAKETYVLPCFGINVNTQIDMSSLINLRQQPILDLPWLGNIWWAHVIRCAAINNKYKGIYQRRTLKEMWKKVRKVRNKIRERWCVIDASWMQMKILPVICCTWCCFCPFSWSSFRHGKQKLVSCFWPTDWMVNDGKCWHRSLLHRGSCI